MSSRANTAKPFFALSNADFLKLVQSIKTIELPEAWFAILLTFTTGPARLALAAHRPTLIGKELILFSAHTHLTSREAGSELLIYEDLWELRKEAFRRAWPNCSSASLKAPQFAKPPWFTAPYGD
jgi:hypothetical protein